MRHSSGIEFSKSWRFLAASTSHVAAIFTSQKSQRLNIRFDLADDTVHV